MYSDDSLHVENPKTSKQRATREVTRHVMEVYLGPDRVRESLTQYDK